MRELRFFSHSEKLDYQDLDHVCVISTKSHYCFNEDHCGYDLLKLTIATDSVFSRVTTWGSSTETRTVTSSPLRLSSDSSERLHYPHRRIQRYSNPAQSRTFSWSLLFLCTLWD